VGAPGGAHVVEELARVAVVLGYADVVELDQGLVGAFGRDAAPEVAAALLPGVVDDALGVLGAALAHHDRPVEEHDHGDVALALDLEVDALVQELLGVLGYGVPPLLETPLGRAGIPALGAAAVLLVELPLLVVRLPLLVVRLPVAVLAVGFPLPVLGVGLPVAVPLVRLPVAVPGALGIARLPVLPGALAAPVAAPAIAVALSVLGIAWHDNHLEWRGNRDPVI
jgi:hypothetical protein